MKLWQGMWEHRAPQVPCFTAAVKPRTRNLTQEAINARNLRAQEALYGGPTKTHDVHPGNESPPSTSYSENIKHEDEVNC